MELEQLLKRIEWLEEERRKDKLVISTLQDQINRMQADMPSLRQQVNEQNREINQVKGGIGRIDQFEAALVQMRVEFNRTIEALEKQRLEGVREGDKVRRVEIEGINKAIAEVRKGLDPIPEIKRSLQSRMEEDFRLSRLIEEVDQKILQTSRSDEEYRRALRLLEENQRQDSKRLTDQQGEMAALRKRVDEQRGKVDLTADNLRKIEARMAEINVAETERRQAQTSFIDKQNLAQVERDRLWKEWSVRFEEIEKASLDLNNAFQQLDATHRSVKRSQEMLDEVTSRFERRIVEITEMQRLAEDRFRQEWNTFKSDDQKRWINYTLAQEEQAREVNRQFELLGQQLTELREVLQEIQDNGELVNQETVKRLKGLLALAHDWMTSYEQATGKASPGGS
ncbi:MAG TPA: hypothetical protein PKW33_15005 [Anaerolineaceae bacterium]|nr:hypothetical protein [Anaerolineaceae bacterium]HPN52901.1 hypothetical protein [Anaerolineaceae bacterium]